MPKLRHLSTNLYKKCKIPIDYKKKTVILNSSRRHFLLFCFRKAVVPMLRLLKKIDTSYFQKENISFFFLNVIYFSANCMFFGFLVMYLTSKGYSGFECGVFNTLISICALIVQPISGYLTDTFITIKKYLIFTSIAAIAFTFALPLTVSNPILAAISVMLMAALVNPSAFLADTWAVTLRETYPHIDYGKNRSGGSIGYCITSIAAGYLVAPLGYHILFILHIVLFVIYILIVLTIPDIPCRNAKSAQPLSAEPSEHKSLSFLQVLNILLKNKPYLLFLTSSFCYYASMRAFSSNVSYKVLSLGGDDSMMGVALAIGAIFEVPFLFIINRCIHRFPLNHLYLFSVFCILFRGLFMAFAPTAGLMYFSQALQACSYGVYVAVSLEIVSRLVPPNIRTTSITLMVAVTSGLGAIIGCFIGGALIDSMGVDLMAYIMSIPCVVGILLYLIPMFQKKSK